MGGYAWVTLATNDSYSLGALVLAHSLKQVGTKQQLAVLITPGVTGPMRSKLSEVFNVVQEVNILDSKDEANLRLLKRPELGVTFTKLHCWRLTQFEKCVFLDADTLVLENCDELFDREELSAAPDIGWPDCFNSGVFVYRPSNETYEKLIQFALEKGSFDGGDQGLLNLYFSDWAYKDISKHLPFIYNMASNACYSYLPAFKQFGGNAKIIHFIGTSKPWLQYFDTETKQVHPSQGYDHLKIILQHWWNIFCSLIHPQLTPDMTTRHTDNLHGSQPSYPPENHSSRNYHTSSSYNQYENTPQPAFNPAEHYQNVWDPWEDYDSRQIQIETVLNVPPHEPYHQPETQTFHDTYHYDSHYHETPSNSQETHNNHSDSTFDQPTHNTYHDNIVHHQNPTTAFHHPVIHNQAQSSSCQSDSSTYHIPESNTDTSIQYHNPPVGNHHQPHSEYVEKHSHSNHSEQKQLFKSHNTNACTDASHCQFGQPHTQGYSPPQSQSIAHNDPPVTPTQEVIYITKNDQYPTLLEENVANQIVSDDVTVQLIADEDKHNDAGIAGAFAKLTLGQPRTPEQLALDDHLRRQGWEVGNIDYLGRDSFDNIWSKICETLSTGPASDPPKAKDPSPPRSEAPTVEQPVLEEVKTDIIPTSEPVTETHPPQASTNEAKPGDAVQPIEEPLKPAEDAPKIEPQSEPSKPTEEIPKPAPEPPKSAVEPLTPEVQSPSPAAEPPKSITEVPKSVPEPLQSVEDIPKLATEPPKPAVESPKSASEPPKPAPEPPQPVTEPLKPTEEPTKSVESPPSAVVPTSPVTEALKTVTESPKSVTEIPEPVQESPKPATESIKPAVEPPKPVQEPSKPKPESPIAVTEPAKLESKQADPPKAVAEPSKPEKKSKTDEPSKETPETPTAEKSASEISSPLVCPIKPKQPAAAEEAKEKEEKKAKKVKDTPKAEVTEATPPSSPLSPQLKQTKESLNVETTVPDTPPPASQESSSTGPTPPPRKGSSGTKKTATKAKK